MTRMDNVYTHSRTLIYSILNDKGMMRIKTSDCNITLYVMTNIVLFNHSITILNNKYAFFEIFINLISIDSWKCFFFYFDSRLFIESNYVII